MKAVALKPGKGVFEAIFSETLERLGILAIVCE